MKLINIGTKIINVGEKILMPGDSMPASAELVQTPAIQAFIGKNLLSTDDSETDFQKAVQAEARRIAAEEAAKKAAAEEAERAAAEKAADEEAAKKAAAESK